MQLILHYDETYREVKYGNMGLPDIDSKMLMGINVTPIAALLYTPVLIRCEAAAMRKGCEGCWPMVFWGAGTWVQAMPTWRGEREGENLGLGKEAGDPPEGTI